VTTGDHTGDRSERLSFPAAPLKPVEPGTNILIAGPSLGGTRELLMRTLLGDPSEGTIVIAADANASKTLSVYEQVGGSPDPARMRVIDCTGRSDDLDHPSVRTLSSPGDLTGIGINFSRGYENLYAEGYDRVRTGIYTLSPLLMYADDLRPIYRFLHTFAGRIQSMDGLGVCAIDPAAQDERTCSSVAQAFNGRIDLREGADGPEIKISGLPDQAAGWRPHTRPE
jgi:hypothetical protein